ncbi:hypothetical protein ELQ35_08585 [Peribacillus cavernae]|uniref:SPOR domain-containing protein n=1 Tax=Peribacillus cavernae TaxID=1674310 RepID=A0A433HQ11_9BACI|nr:hypothetical protein [Peribacillus cavernae]MDQ0217139.1 monoamine oxidase [Peribacillus cavernae]RUQ30385.1 hypothetical protein ELQ35_08585 [Peribacillus cavernae]
MSKEIVKFVSDQPFVYKVVTGHFIDEKQANDRCNHLKELGIEVNIENLNINQQINYRVNAGIYDEEKDALKTFIKIKNAGIKDTYIIPEKKENRPSIQTSILSNEIENFTDLKKQMNTEPSFNEKQVQKLKEQLNVLIERTEKQITINKELIDKIHKQNQLFEDILMQMTKNIQYIEPLNKVKQTEKSLWKRLFEHQS